MRAPLAIVLIVVDSLRFRSLRPENVDGGIARLRTPFFDSLDDRMTSFSRAHATECWTLPTHVSMFTGRLPSEHGAHFQNLSYAGAAPTLAERLTERGYETHLLTRNSILDGSLPGVTRGFRHNDPILADLHGGGRGLGLLLALSKPRVRRLIRDSGFFHSLQREQRKFLVRLARMSIPADTLALQTAVGLLQRARREARKTFLLLNLYDVHSPYAPRMDSPLAPPSLEGLLSNLLLAWVLPKISAHGYLRPGFRLSKRSRRMLLGRYERAIELMDVKLGRFVQMLADDGLLDDVALVLTSDHGEAFGDHGLYLHDGSVYQTHLHVPLWVHVPGMRARRIDDVVSTVGVHDLVESLARGGPAKGTLLDAEATGEQAVALAEHFHYPAVRGALPEYSSNVAAARVGRRKAIVRRDRIDCYDLDADHDERHATRVSIGDFDDLCRADRSSPAAIDAALAHLSRWSIALGAARPARSRSGPTQRSGVAQT